MNSQEFWNSEKSFHKNEVFFPHSFCVCFCGSVQIMHVMSGDILLNIPALLLGPPQNPDWPLLYPVEHVYDVALRSRWLYPPIHLHRKAEYNLYRVKE